MSAEPRPRGAPSEGDRALRDAPRAPVAALGLATLRRARAAPPGHLEACLLSLAASPVDAPEPVAVLAAGGACCVAPAVEGSDVPLERITCVSSGLEPGGARLAVVAGDAAALGRPAVVWCLDGDTIFGPRVTADEVARITARVEALIERAVASPSAPLAELLAVPERERRELLAWGRGAAVGAPSGTAADDVRRSARATPGAPALAAGGEVLDYAALDRRVDAFAAGLLGRGVGRGSRVAVALERGVDLVAAMLAAWRVGAAYVPIDLAHPAERVARLLDDASCALLVHGGGASASACARWDVEDEPPPAVARPSRPDEAELGGEIAYIIYTSGSTGRPKGVEVEHAALRNTIRAKVELVAMRPGDTQLAVMSAAFDASIFELTMPLLAGARLVVATRGELEDFAALAATAGRVGASVVGATPHTWRGLLEAGWRPPAGLRALVGGEALPPDLGARLASFCRVFNMYGLTETAISSTYFEVGAGLAGEGVPIGRPLPNVLTRVVGPLGGLARVGEAGELYVGGLGLARGYRGGEALTRERFVADPAGETGARFFRTGDRARVCRDGQLEYLGRLDTQVKVRGARVELGEVEAALADAPGVAAAVADVREFGGAPCIVAYVVARGGALAEADLRALAGRRLPPHMVPSAFVTIERVPLTSNGKVDRTALPPPPTPASAAEGAAPGGGADDPLAAAVREAFAAVLGPGCNLSLDFTALGLDSIGRSRVRQALGRRGVEVALVDLFERRGAAELVAALRSRGASPRPPAPPRSEYDRPRPVTMNQRHPILTHLANPGTGAWNCQIACAFEGDVDLAALELAWRAVVERHGALRLGFRWRGLAYPTQGIGAGVTAPWSVLDLRGEGVAYARALRDLQERELRTTFDVERPPLHRLCVVRSPDGSLELIWTYFSALLDGWSSVIVLRDLVAHYAAAVSGALPPAPAPHFFDHLDRMAARDWSASEPFFREALAGYRPPPSIGRPPGGDDQERSTAALPSDLRMLFEALGDKPFRTQGVGAKSARLSEAETARLGLAAARHGVAESTILQSAWAIALMREYGCDDILVGMVAANRPDYEAAVGKYTSMLPFRFRLGRPRPLGDWLRGNERYVLETLAHEGVPSEHWVGAIGLERWQFPFESTFTFVNYVARPGGGGGDGPPRVTHCRQLDAGIPPAFGMVVIPGESHLARLEYNRAGGFDEARLEGLLDAFLDALARLSGSPAEADVASWLGGTLGARSVGVRLGLL